MTNKEIVRLEKEAESARAVFEEKSQDRDQVKEELRIAGRQLTPVEELENLAQAANEVVKSAKADHDSAVLAVGQVRFTRLEESARAEIENALDIVDALAASAAKIEKIQNETVGVYMDEVKPYLKADEQQGFDLKIQAIRKASRIIGEAAEHANPD